MQNKTLLIKNGYLINSKNILKADVFISDGKILEIGDLSSIKSEITIDASDKYILPGIIDPQVHFRDPGLTHKEDLRTGAMSAVAGGVTTFFEMPNTNPSTTTLEKLAEKHKVASTKSIANYSFFLGATNDNIDEIQKIDCSCGLKIFMGSSTGSRSEF